MKFATVIAATAAFILPVTAGAQSLSDTHERVWHPAGKTPSVTYRLRDKPACVTKSDHHRAGRGQYQPPKSCPAVAITEQTPATAAGN